MIFHFFLAQSKLHRSTWLRGPDVFSSSETSSEIPNILHVVRYGADPMSFMVRSKYLKKSFHSLFSLFQEAVCIKAFLVQQNPEKFYLHSNIVDLTQYGEHWIKLYKGGWDDNSSAVSYEGKFVQKVVTMYCMSQA